VECSHTSTVCPAYASPTKTVTSPPAVALAGAETPFRVAGVIVAGSTATGEPVVGVVPGVVGVPVPGPVPGSVPGPVPGSVGVVPGSGTVHAIVPPRSECPSVAASST
jgi:hypothetical protein